MAMNNLDEMRDLIDKLNYYTKLYDEGHPEITDKEWDRLYFQLQELEEETNIILSDSPTVHIDYGIQNELKKVEHNHPMLSLSKTKNEEDIVNFAQNRDLIAMAKMDGLTCSIRYLNGKLISAETRGNGIIGEDITHNIINVRFVPYEIPIKDEVIIDGEVICTIDIFEKYFKDKYANPRNFAAGSIRLLDPKECKNRFLSFIAWDCIKGLEEFQTLNEKLFTLDSWGFNFTPYVVIPNYMTDLAHIRHATILIKQMAKEFYYPIDGIVFKYDNCKYYYSLGYTNHHFRGGLAFKFYDEEYETYLKNIEWSMGKTGQLTPVAIFDPVDDGESIIQRASLHNINIMKQLLGDKPYIGQKIWVCKMNEIIPQIIKSEKENYIQDLILDIPNKCPICGESTIIKDDFLYCSNSNCEGKFINKLEHFVGKKGLDIKGLSKATLQKLINWEWVNLLSDIFKLYEYRNEWYKKDGFGIKSVDNILNAIENSKECELWQFISALSIPLIGSTYAKEIARRCSNWLQFMECIGPHMGIEYDFTQWENFGPNMNNSLHNYDYTEANELIKILHLKNSLWNNSKENQKNKYIFVITGKLNLFKNREELQKYIEDKGGKVSSSISKNTSYLINNDINSTSSKNLKAKQLNIPIITESQMMELI